MEVVKRDGRCVPVAFDKILARIQKLCYGFDVAAVDAALVAQKVVTGLRSGMHVVEIDELAAETAAYMSTQHPDYSQLAARISVSNLHKQTRKAFSETMTALYEFSDTNGRHCPKISLELYRLANDNKNRLDSVIMHDRDFGYDYFGFKTLERAYLQRIDDKVVERPQHMLMRVALGIHGSDLERAITTYEDMSKKIYTHATPTMFNAGTPEPQMSSCFLVDMESDSIDGIFRTLNKCANISKCAGGIGISATRVRSTGSIIRGSGGQSNGLTPMLRVFDATARYVDQGGGKRKGAFAIYIEPWHADIEEFLELRKNHGKEEARARDLFYGLWICDLFMERVEQDKEWSLFCPDDCPKLHQTFGKQFVLEYLLCERLGRAKKTLRARELWSRIIQSQIETGTPYMLYKDSVNRKSNQSNVGMIRCSNLCTEIVEYTSPDEIAVCNLASIALPHCVRRTGDKTAFQFDDLARAVRVLVFNLNRIIDRNAYPVTEARVSNLRHRPIGIGVQGLADVFIMLRLPFDSDEAVVLNRDIFETIYFAALSESNALAKTEGAYSTFADSPASKGVFQFDLWNVEPSDRHDWHALKSVVREHGLRNSLLVAPMPTASTAQILGNNECFEPYTSNIYSRRVLAGEFAVVNKHLLSDLLCRGLWTDELREDIIRGNGSVQHIDAVPEDLKLLYRTAWELKQRTLIDMAADRGAFIDQSQSLNLFVKHATSTVLSSMHFYGWKKGLKTGMYYLRTQPACDAIKVTVAPHKAPDAITLPEEQDECVSCSA